jgi:hypothetical protein
LQLNCLKVPICLLCALRLETHLQNSISSTQSVLMPDYLFKMKLPILSDMTQGIYCTDCFQTVVGRAVLILFAKSMYFLPFIHNVFEQHSVLLLLLFRQVWCSENHMGSQECANILWAYNSYYMKTSEKLSQYVLTSVAN